MIRALIKSVNNVTVSEKLLYSPTLGGPMLRRFKYTDIVTNAEKTGENTLNELERYRQAEVHLWHSLGFRCIDPAELTKEQWQHLYELDTKHQRKRFVKYLLVRKNAKELQKAIADAEKEAKKGNRERIQAERSADPHIVYGLGHNCLHIRITSQIMNKWINVKLHQAKLHGQKVIIDCSFEPYMTDLERNKVASGLRRVYSDNRKHIKPMDLHFCGVKTDSIIIKNLSGQVPKLLKQGSPTRLHSECFTELFPKERLVMLTPDSDQLLDYNADDIYVVGGIVDFGRCDPLTLAKAKKLGIRSARLPLDNIRLRAGDTRELSMAQTISLVRERQINDNMGEIIRNFIKLKSERQFERNKENA